jgi:hypothetical protein
MTGELWWCWWRWCQCVSGCKLQENISGLGGGMQVEMKVWMVMKALATMTMTGWACHHKLGFITVKLRDGEQFLSSNDGCSCARFWTAQETCELFLWQNLHCCCSCRANRRLSWGCRMICCSGCGNCCNQLFSYLDPAIPENGRGGSCTAAVDGKIPGDIPTSIVAGGGGAGLQVEILTR